MRSRSWKAKQRGTERHGEFIAGKFEFEHGNVDQAHRYFDSALRFQSENSTILIYYAALLVRTGKPTQALPYAQRAVRTAPNSPDAYTILGYSQFACDRTKEAIASWKHSLELRPDSAVQQFLAKHSVKTPSRRTSPSVKAAILSFTTRQTDF